MKRNDRKISRWQAFWFSVKIMPGSFAIMLLLGLLNSALAAGGVCLTGWVFSVVEESAVRGAEPALYGAVAAYGLYLIASGLYLYGYERYVVQFLSLTRYEGRVFRLLHQKAERISNEQLETPSVYAHIRQASNARQNLYRYVEICIAVFSAGVQAAAVTAGLSAFAPWYAVLLPIAVVLPLVEELHRTRLWKKDRAEAAQLQREAEAYEAAVTGDAAVKETRLTGSALLMKKWRDSRGSLAALEDRRSRRLFALRGGLSLPEGLSREAGLLVSALLLYHGRIGLPAFFAGVAAYASLVSSLRELLQMTGEFNHFYEMLVPFFRYWNLDERGGTGEGVTVQKEIRLEKVSFCYQNRREKAIDSIDLVLYPGETVAIVGENGAGKTTLANLVLGIFSPTEGRVLYDGVDLQTVREPVVHKMQSGVLQSFARYQMTAGENIAMGDWNKADPVEIEKQLAEIFPDGTVTAATPLGREFGGVELSGGEWQRLACARGFYKESSIILLDEATSAIDPLRETVLYEEFQKNLAGRTGLIVTHRLGAVRLADRILVLSGGQIVEDGTHQVLLAQNGLYAALWRSQAEAYVTR